MRPQVHCSLREDESERLGPIWEEMVSVFGCGGMCQGSGKPIKDSVIFWSRQIVEDGNGLGLKD